MKIPPISTDFILLNEYIRKDGGNRIFYTLLGSCLQAGIEPHKGLTSTLEKIPLLQNPIN